MNARTKQASAPRQLEYRINRRLHHRYVMVMRDGFLHVGEERVPCVVRNISSGGLMARSLCSGRPGETVKIELATGELIDGTVLWMKDWTIGVAFTGTVDIESILAEQWTSETDGDRRRTRATRSNARRPSRSRPASISASCATFRRPAHASRPAASSGSPATPCWRCPTCRPCSHDPLGRRARLRSRVPRTDPRRRAQPLAARPRRHAGRLTPHRWPCSGRGGPAQAD